MYNGYYYGFDMTYLVLVVPALLIALIAQIQVKSAFSRYAGVRCTSGLTGAQAAQRILQANGITDVRIELTKNDYRILQTLLERKGSVVSRETLMEKLWETDSFVDENTLTVNIARLRRKLEAAGLSDYITTKKGLGYLIE